MINSDNLDDNKQASGVEWEAGYLHGVAEERELLALELHDSLLQDLAYLRLRLDQLEWQLRRDPSDAMALVSAVRGELQSTAAAAREIAIGLMRESTPTDFVDALMAKVERFQRRFDGHIKVDHVGQPLALEARAATHLLRMFEEVLNNVWKHAQARRVSIRLEFQVDGLCLRVADDGRGFDSSQSDEQLGLRSIRERARLIDASLAITTAPGEGTTVEIACPARTVTRSAFTLNG